MRIPFLTMMLAGSICLLACDLPPKNQGGNTMDSTHCDETTTVLTGTDTVSSIVGLSAQELLSATGDQIEVDAWYTDETEILTQSPLGGDTDLTITVSYNGGEIREIDAVLFEGGEDIYLECDPRLEVDVVIGFSTGDGAFDETWNGVVSAVGIPSAALVPTLTADLDPEDLTGSFEIVSMEASNPDSVGGLFSAELQPEPNGPAGSDSILVEESGGSGDDGWVSESNHTAIMWGNWY